jgi:hypothetical protein
MIETINNREGVRERGEGGGCGGDRVEIKRFEI